jgi:hypothetical protein
MYSVLKSPNRVLIIQNITVSFESFLDDTLFFFIHGNLHFTRYYKVLFIFSEADKKKQ